MFPRMFLVALFGIGTKIVLLFALCGLNMLVLTYYRESVWAPQGVWEPLNSSQQALHQIERGRIYNISKWFISGKRGFSGKMRIIYIVCKQI